jgi:tRNA threonylcarbamoyladenosine biosynthesis protein TsaB
MNVVAIETSGQEVGVALGEGPVPPRLLAVQRYRIGPRHAELLTPMLAQVLETCSLVPKDIEAVLVDAGPGLLSGLRVGVATAKALAWAVGAKVVAVSSLDVLAFQARREGPLVAVADARKGELYWAFYQGMERSGAPKVGPVSEAVAQTREWLDAGAGAAVAVGDGVLRYAEEFADIPDLLIGSGEDATVSVEAVFALGCRKLDLEGGIEARELLPTYLRPPDAKVNFAVGIEGGGSTPVSQPEEPSK